MGQVHHLITAHGVERARELTTDKTERQCVETAFCIMADESQRVGVMHAGFAMTSLPHREQKELEWIREGGPIKLRIESGKDEHDTPVGIPYGSVARIILLYLQTEAVKTRSREIELGKCMNMWLSSMGIDDGGRQYRLVREQSKRISLCRLTFYSIQQDHTQIENGSFVRNAILPPAGKERQLSLWREMVTLDETFYRDLMRHPMPIREAAIRALSGKSMAIDVYIWLAYRLHRLTKPTAITWSAIFDQFGAGYAQIRQFRAKFKDTLDLALAAYEQARVDINEKGLILHPSPPAVPERALIRSV